MKTVPYSVETGEEEELQVQMTLTRSSRKTVGLKIRNSRDITLTFPMQFTDSDIENFLEKRRCWIDHYVLKARLRELEAEDLPMLTYDELAKLANDSKGYRTRTVPYSADTGEEEKLQVQMTLTRSSRKTVGLKIKNSRNITLTFPRHFTDSDIEDFLVKRRSWIDHYVQKTRMRELETGALPMLTYEELAKLGDDTLSLLMPLLDEYIPLLRVRVNRVTVKAQRTRWGSCSVRGNLNFNCLLALTPDYVQRYIVVHELCHLLNMNHSPAYWAEVARIMPDYEMAEAWIKAEGWKLFKRLPSA